MVTGGLIGTPAGQELIITSYSPLQRVGSVPRVQTADSGRCVVAVCTSVCLSVCLSLRQWIKAVGRASFVPPVGESITVTRRETNCFDAEGNASKTSWWLNTRRKVRRLSLSTPPPLSHSKMFYRYTVFFLQNSETSFTAVDIAAIRCKSDNHHFHFAVFDVSMRR